MVIPFHWHIQNQGTLLCTTKYHLNLLPLLCCSGFKTAEFASWKVMGDSWLSKSKGKTSQWKSWEWPSVNPKSPSNDYFVMWHAYPGFIKNFHETEKYCHLELRWCTQTSNQCLNNSPASNKSIRLKTKDRMFTNSLCLSVELSSLWHHSLAHLRKPRLNP